MPNVVSSSVLRGNARFRFSPWLILLLALLAYEAATLGRVPARPNDDDGSYAAAAYQFWRTGRPGVAGYRDVVGMEEDVRAYGRTAAAIQGAFLHLTGVSLWATQLPSWLAGLALVAATAALGRKLWDAETGLRAALLLAASGKFFEASRWARPDMLLAFYFLLSLWLAASAQTSRPYRRLFLAGLVMGLAGDVHLNGFLIGPVPLLFWFLLYARPWPVRWRASLVFITAAGLGLVFWLALHYWPDPQGFRRQIAVHGGQTHRWPIAERGWLGALAGETKRYTDWFWAARGRRHLLEGFCVLAAGLWLLLRGGRSGVTVVGAWVALFLIAAALMSNPFGWYLILAWPLFALWMARAWVTHSARGPVGILGLALAAAYLLNLGLWHWKALQEESFQASISELRRQIPAGVPVLGNGAFWFAFWDRDFTDEYSLYLREIEVRLYPRSGPTGWEHEQRRRGWRYIVASGDLRRLLDPEVPLEDVLTAAAYRGREDFVGAARSFSLERCSVERRFRGAADTILVLRVHDGPP